MFYAEISGLSAKEIVKKKKELQAEMFDARMKNSMGQLTNPMVIRTARKDIARLNTAMTLLAKKSAGTAAPKAPAKKSAPKAGKKPAAKSAARGKKG